MLRIFVFSLFITFCSCDDFIIPWPPKENYSIQPVDHFSFSASNRTFRVRYLYEDKWFKVNGPIFFYCGNEGSIESFWNNSGYIFQLASSINALVVFAEHRYYGKSLPFEHPFVQPQIQFLSVEQALADYVYLIDEVKQKLAKKNTPVIAFGGSYGGMLAAYMRVKYPHVVAGAIAASAPVNWVAGLGNFHQFFEAVTNDYRMVTPKCVNRIKEAYTLIEQTVKKDPSKLIQLSKQLRLCSPMRNSADLAWMLKWSRNAFVMMAMMDYPSKASFMADLPPYPVNVSCASALNASDPVAALREAVSVMYNSSSKLQCFDYKKQYIECADITGCGLDNDSLAWDFQSCTEMNLFDSSNSTEADMFPSLPLSRETVAQYCKSRWGVNKAFNQLANFYGPDIWKTASNIIFSNGNLDPWMPGGILKDQSPTVLSLVIDGGAHHLDLRLPDANDPPSARIVRQAEADHILTWIDRARS